MSIKHSKLHKLSYLALAITSVWSANSHAMLAQNMSVDLRSLSLGNAVTADPPGINAIHFNPAGLTKIKGLQLDIQLMMADFAIEADLSAPKGFEVFGYSDDPVVCDDAPNDGEQLCSNFKTAHTKVDGVALYLPILDKMVKLPPGPVTAPTAGIAYKPPGSKYTYANAFYAPMIAGYYRDDKDPGVYMGRKVALERITYLSPSVAYQINDELSVGLSVGMSYQAIALDTDFRAPNPLVGVFRLFDDEICGPFRENANLVTDLLLFGICNANESLGPFKKAANLDVSLQQTLSPTYNLGVLWEPNERFAWGAVYQSGNKMRLKGKYKVTYTNGTRSIINDGLQSSVTGQILGAILGLPSYIPENEQGLLSMNLDFPAHFQTGIKYKILPQLQINFDVGWTEFGVWDAFNFEFDREVQVLKIAKILVPGTTNTTLAFPLDFNTRWNWGVGMEYSHTSRLKFRMGYEPRDSAVPDDKRNILAPINSAKMFGLGMGYRFDPDTDIDLTLMHLISRDTVPANTSTLLNQTGVTNAMYNPYAGLDAKTKATVNIMGLVYRTRW
ncbi:MAG: outer membrane protein transport protein [Moraxellaceae bacterium]|nr:outer membrane protein transport protein [Moraxellaceae bacterium]